MILIEGIQVVTARLIAEMKTRELMAKRRRRDSAKADSAEPSQPFTALHPVSRA